MHLPILSCIAGQWSMSEGWKRSQIRGSISVREMNSKNSQHRLEFVIVTNTYASVCVGFSKETKTLGTTLYFSPETLMLEPKMNATVPLFGCPRMSAWMDIQTVPCGHHSTRCTFLARCLFPTITSVLPARQRRLVISSFLSGRWGFLSCVLLQPFLIFLSASSFCVMLCR